MHGEDSKTEAYDFSKIKWNVTLIDFFQKSAVLKITVDNHKICNLQGCVCFHFNKNLRAVTDGHLFQEANLHNAKNN